MGLRLPWVSGLLWGWHNIVFWLVLFVTLDMVLGLLVWWFRFVGVWVGVCLGFRVCCGVGII